MIDRVGRRPILIYGLLECQCLPPLFPSLYEVL